MVIYLLIQNPKSKPQNLTLPVYNKLERSRKSEWRCLRRGSRSFGDSNTREEDILPVYLSFGIVSTTSFSSPPIPIPLPILILFPLPPPAMSVPVDRRILNPAGILGTMRMKTRLVLTLTIFLTRVPRHLPGSSAGPPIPKITAWIRPLSGRRRKLGSPRGLLEEMVRLRGLCIVCGI